MTTSIPQPPAIPFLGNVTALDKELPLRSFELLAEKYGEIYQLNMLGNPLIVVNSYALVNELSNEKRFNKNVGAALNQVRNLVGDGLFTAHNEEHNWGIAHRLLMPAFGPAAIRDTFDGMVDMASQLLLKWERFGPENVIDVTDEFTRLALDTLAYCTMSYRLNSFYMEGQPKFATAMGDVLRESFARSTRPSVIQAMMTGANAKYDEDIKYMRGLASQIVADRRAHPTDKNDLLTKMLSGRDPKTGEGMSDDNITNNLLTFMIAGHETSSGTLSFAIYYLLKNPDVIRKLRDEIDAVIGEGQPKYEHLSKLPYLTAIVRETLRLQPPASTRGVKAIEDTVVGDGKYAIKAGAPFLIQTWVAMRDPALWGEDVLEFKPERMLDGKFEALPPNAWQPFGYGMRACIGRPFAWQEIMLAIASVVQKFDLSLVDPAYMLELKQALTIKPKGLKIRAALRTRPHRLFTTTSSSLKADSGSATRHLQEQAADGTAPLYVLYGSNTGTSEAFAQRIASDAPTYGFRPSLGAMDAATGQLPKDGPIVIVTASFEGEPADNAAKFVDWLKNIEGDEFTGVRYIVFGCGNHDWVSTYQRVPKLCDSLLEQHGGKRLMDRGEGDAGASNFFEVFDEFEAKIWETLSKEFQISKKESVSAGFEVKTVDPGTARATILRQPEAALGSVVENRVLTKPGTPVKRHIEFKLPEAAAARAGDYLAILPHNPPRNVHRVLAHFGLSSEQQVIVSSISPTSLPLDKPSSLAEILGGYVELSQPATSRDLRSLIEVSTMDSTRAILKGLSAAYTEKVLAKRLSVLDILEAYKDIKLSLSAFLQMLPAMRVRQYSISSSPLWNPLHVTLTVSVIEAPAISGHGEEFLGVGSNYLANLRPGDRVQMSVRPSSAAFHPPADPLVPLVLFCSGSGLAPMRGFIQERAVQKQSGREVGKALLFFGCRSPEEDFLYSDSDLGEWIKLGVVDVRPAFSRSSSDSEGCKYVQDRIWHDREDISKAYDLNAKFFSCGSGKVATGIKTKLIEIIKGNTNVDDAEAVAKFERVGKDRYATDIFD